jgi:tRNA(Ile)-lysidine synthase
LALKQVLGAQRLLAAHVDHGGQGSGDRCTEAERLARRCGVDFAARQRNVDLDRRAGESWETAARRVRYRALEEIADHAAVHWIATAHHLEDQAETVILRLRQGSDWMGLAGIAPRRGRVVRPALGVSKWQLRALVVEAGLQAVQDPTNRQPRGARNHVRLFILPRLLRDSAIDEVSFARLMSRVAEAAGGARERLAGRNGLELSHSAAIRRFRATLAALEARVPAPGRAALEAAPQGARQADVFTGRGGHSWRRSTLRPCAPPRRTSEASFSYTFSAPGRVELSQLGVAIRVSREQIQPWMYAGRPDSAAFQLSDGAESVTLEVRPRRPGDRLRPLGSSGSRKLKDVLIDRRIPADDRGRLPLLVHAGKIVWVPGVTVDEDFRLRHDGPCWVAFLEPLKRFKEAY